MVASAADGIRVSLAGEIGNDTGEELRQVLDVSGTPQPRLVFDMPKTSVPVPPALSEGKRGVRPSAG